MKNSSRPGGVIVPILTPLTGGGMVDDAGLRRLIKRGITAGVDAIFMGGSAGMGPMLLPKQWEQALEIAVDEVKGRVLLMSGIIETSTQRALIQIETSRRLGCPAIVVTPTFYISLARPAEMLAHFEACRDATEQEMVIYNIPSCTNSSIFPEVVRTCVEKGWTRAIKESSGDREYFLRVLEAVKGLDVALLQGNEPDIAWGLKQGAAGIVPVCANCEPATFVSAVEAARAGDWDRVDELQRRIDELRDTILVGDHNWISGLFAALDELGIAKSQPLLPLQPVGEERRLRIRNFFAHAAKA